MSPLWAKVTGYDADVTIVDGHKLDDIREALRKHRHRLHLMFLRTVKGHGVDFMADRMELHYLPLTEEQYQSAVARLETA